MAKRVGGQRRGRKAAGGSPFDGISEGRKSRHREVLDALLNEIASGRIQPGDRLPTETELAANFAASRSTVSRALRDLKHRGLLNRQRGGGTHVAKLKTGRHIALFAPFALTAANLGWIGGQIHAHLSEVASWREDHLRLQMIARSATSAADPLEGMLASAQSLIDQGMTGVFYYPTELPQAQAHYNQIVVDKLKAAGIAMVAVDRDIVSFPHRSSLPLVTYDNRRAGYIITEHLIQRRCKRIAFIGSTKVSSAASDRMRGYYDALEDNGFGPDRSLVFRANLEDLHLEFCGGLLKDLKPDAILCKSDDYAAVVARHLVSLNKTIGRDVMLAGFDDEPFAELIQVPLTTIRFPPEPFAVLCYERLISQMSDPPSPAAGMMLMDVELVVRESTGG